MSKSLWTRIFAYGISRQQLGDKRWKAVTIAMVYGAGLRKINDILKEI